ncbi:hypothetical protein [Pseudoruegeria sp. HB172150]|nr:hypothetical protein [Pseudoruegeria sp. HB172150]
MRWLWLLTAALLMTACGVDGPPAPPGSEIDPRTSSADDVDPDGFF